MPPDMLFIRMGQDPQLGDDLVGGGGAAHTHDGIVVGGAGEVGFGKAIELFSLSGCYRDDNDEAFEAVAMISAAGVVEGFPEGADAFGPEGGLEVGVFAAGEDMTPGMIFCRGETENAVPAQLEGDMTARSPAEPFVLAGMAFCGLRAINDE